ncbi:hypothetical protein [Spirosoma flavus]
MKLLLALWEGILINISLYAQPKFPTGTESDFTIQNFRFATGDVLPQLNIHYTTIGQPVKDRNGTVTNAVLINCR